MRRYTKIKHKDRVELQWEEGAQEKTAITHALSSVERPAPSYIEAFRGLIRPILKLLQLPDDYAEGLRVTGVSFTHEEERGRGVVVTALKTLDNASAPLVLNTPYLPESSENDEPTVPVELANALDVLCDAAESYMAGEREQGSLFGGPESSIGSVTISDGKRSVTLENRKPSLVR